MPAGPSATSANVGMPGSYASASTQLTAAYPAAPTNSGFEAVSRPLDEVVDSVSALQIRFVIPMVFYFSLSKLIFYTITWSLVCVVVILFLII